MFKIYGHPQTRTFRTLWMAEELGLAYEHQSIGGPQTRTSEFLKINPNGHVPTLQDGDVILFESLAINLYLASKYGVQSGLWPASLEDQGRAYQWSFWAVNETEPHVVELLFQRVILAAAQRNPHLAEAAEHELAAPLRVLDAALEGRDYLLGDTFSVADVNVGGVLAPLLLVRFDTSRFSGVTDWLERISARPTMARARKR